MGHPACASCPCRQGPARGRGGNTLCPQSCTDVMCLSVPGPIPACPAKVPRGLLSTPPSPLRLQCLGSLVPSGFPGLLLDVTSQVAGAPLLGVLHVWPLAVPSKPLFTKSLVFTGSSLPVWVLTTHSVGFLPACFWKDPMDRASVWSAHTWPRQKACCSRRPADGVPCSVGRVPEGRGSLVGAPAPWPGVTSQGHYWLRGRGR